jgi:SAM-dependent methyltransferase
MTEKDQAPEGATTDDVKQFWELNPLASAAIPFERGSAEYFEYHNRLKRAEESPDLDSWVYEPEMHRGERILEIGCGNGYVTQKYAAVSDDVSAIDITENGVNLTRKRLEWLDLKADIRQADALSLPFADNEFDLVVSHGVLHYVPNVEDAVYEVRRVLKPGGTLRLMMYHRGSFAYRLLFPAKRWLQPSWRGKTAEDQINAVSGPDNPYTRVYSRRELAETFKGFEDFQFRTGNMFFRWKWLVPSPLRPFINNRWGWHLYAKARKSG